MIYPESMARITIAAPQTRMKEAIEILHHHGVLHIVDHHKDELDIGAPLPESTRLSDELIRIRSVMHSLGITTDEEVDEDTAQTVITGDLSSQIERVQDAVNKNRAERKTLEERAAVHKKSRAPHHERDIEAVERGIANNEASFARLRAQHHDFLLQAEAHLAVETRKAQSPLRFAVTKRSFVVSGWVPTKRLAALEGDLERTLNGEVSIDVQRTKEEAPVKLQNSEVVKPFETLLNLYTLPKYSEIDPTTFLFLSFPIFFGFILGDIGYGLILLTTAFIMRATSRERAFMRSVANILIMSSVATIVFGCIFGEFFGLEHLGAFEIPHLLLRAHDMMTLLLVAIGVGIIHITIALLVGFVNELHHHGAWKAFCAKIAWLILLIGVGLVASDIIFPTHTSTIGYVIIALSVILIVIGEGVRGLIEIPSIFSNILSYARLMAVGVASAALAVVVNEMAGGLFATGDIVNIIIAIVIILVGHSINLALGLLGSVIHSLRLHYIEFFSKFYEGGGKPYKPFGGDK